jgi:hypothetical protein
MRQHKHTKIEPTREAEDQYRKLVIDLSAAGLWGKAKSWYIGANIEGKPVEPLAFTGGVPLYRQLWKSCADNGYEGFELK